MWDCGLISHDEVMYDTSSVLTWDISGDYYSTVELLFNARTSKNCDRWLTKVRLLFLFHGCLYAPLHDWSSGRLCIFLWCLWFSYSYKSWWWNVYNTWKIKREGRCHLCEYIWCSYMLVVLVLSWVLYYSLMKLFKLPSLKLH